MVGGRMNLKQGLVATLRPMTRLIINTLVLRSRALLEEVSGYYAKVRFTLLGFARAAYKLSRLFVINKQAAWQNWSKGR